MSIPGNILKAHIDQAISSIKESEIPKERLSRNYFLRVGDRTLPPKYVISIANKYVNNKELNSREFNAVEAKYFLSKLGYNIIGGDSEYYPELAKFLDQAMTTDLTTSHYDNEYSELKVKVSFGQGNQARVPWIAFLNKTDTVQQGIYPVYLYYKEKKLLILAYGVSETRPSAKSWNISNGKTIEQYFAENNLGKPERYGSSFVFKIYHTNQPLIEEDINRDLTKLINIYIGTSDGLKPIKMVTFEYKSFTQDISRAGFFINNTIGLRFIASLLTKPFVILTGLSGSGKTKLAQIFASWICESNKQYLVVPVGSDWTNREPLLGFPNALKSDEYVKPDNRVLDLIITANNDRHKPYFLILDEMNLSHVERYFADFLSVMESHEKISLHSGIESWNDVPSEIALPKNLFIIGTVNIDETTYMFSPKVLDRANVIEFRVSNDEMKKYLGNTTTLNLKSLNSLGATMAEDFLEIAADNSFVKSIENYLQVALLNFFTELKKSGAEFGYRSATEIFRFAAVVNRLDSGWTSSDIIDAAVMQKLLPKVHGSRRKLEPILKTLGALCLQDGFNIDEFISPKNEIVFTDISKIKYPLSLEKILRMNQSLIDNGFTSYAEA